MKDKLKEEVRRWKLILYTCIARKAGLRFSIAQCTVCNCRVKPFFKAAMSKSISSFATNVANQYGHSPHFYGIAATKHHFHVHLIVTKIIEISQILHPEPTLTVFHRKVWIKLQMPRLVPNFAQNNPILRYLESKPFATFKWPFATCGEWRMGWTTLF